MCSTQEQLDAGWHLLRGGEQARGAEYLADAGLQLVKVGDGLAAAVPALEAALKVFRRQGKDEIDLIRLLGPLAMAGYYSDRRLAETYGDEAIALYRKVLGLDVAERLRPLLGATLSIHLALARSAMRFALRKDGGGLAGVVSTLQAYAAVVACLVGVSTICLDSKRSALIARNLEPLVGLGKDSAPAHLYRLVQLMTDIPRERIVEVTSGLLELLARLNNPRPIKFLDSGLRKQFHAGVLYALGSMQTFTGTNGALHAAAALDQIGLKQYEMVADQLRASHHVLRGEFQLDERYRQRVEQHALQSGTAWQAEVWAPAGRIPAYVLAQDSIGLRRTVEELEQQSADVPSLVRIARLARAEYQLLKGNYESGAAMVAAELEATVPREFLGRASVVGSMAACLNRLGRFEEAKNLMTAEIAKISTTDQEAVALYSNIFQQLARALAGLGDFENAFIVVAEQLGRQAASDNPLLIGNLHATATEVALCAQDLPRAQHHFSQVTRWFEPTKNPALVRRCERLRRKVTKLAGGHGAATQAPPLRGGVAEDSPGPSTLVSSARSARMALARCRTISERAERAREMLLAHVGAQTGFIFGVRDGNVALLAPQHGEEPTTGQLQHAQSNFDAALRDTMVPSTADASRATTPQAGPASSVATGTRDDCERGTPPPSPPTATNDHRVFQLWAYREPHRKLVALFAAATDDRQLPSPDTAFLQAVAESLDESIDSTTPATRAHRP